MAVGLAYFITGKLGLALAIPPGYATAIWPPSGIALAAILLCGYRVWPGILFGSFFVNVPAEFQFGALTSIFQLLTIPTIIAAGASLQAVMGGFLVKRYGRFPNPLQTFPQVLGLLALGGMVGSLINSSISVSSLFAAGRVPLADAPFTWMTWWVGDACGVFVFTPSVIALLKHPREEWTGRATKIIAVTAITFGLVVGLVAYASHLERKDFNTQLVERGESLNASLEKMITTRLNAVRAAEAFLGHSEKVTAKEFAFFASSMRTNIQGVLALEWIPIVPDRQRANFESWARQNGLANFKITESGPDGLQPAQPRDEYFPVTFAEPLGPNSKAIGFDLGSNEQRRSAIIRARTSEAMAVTERIALVQGGNAVLALAPVKKQPADNGSSDIQGFALGVIPLQDVTNIAFLGTDLTNLHYWLMDETDGQSPTILSSNTTDSPSAFKLDEHGLFGEHGALEFQRSQLAEHPCAQRPGPLHSRGL